LFEGIHQDLIETIGYSPLKAVECFDWPDVCQNVTTTYPHMLYGNDEDNFYIYRGLWHIEEMRKAVIINGIHQMKNSDEKSALIDSASKFGVSIIKFNIATSIGEKMFNKFSTKYGNDYVVLKEISKDNNDSFQIIQNNENYTENKKLISEQQIINQLQSGRYFQNMELNAYEFFKHALQEQKFIILFVNGELIEWQENLLRSLQRILNKNKNSSHMLKWMNKANGSSGNEILRTYTDDVIPQVPVACINQDKVTVTSFENMSDEKMEIWMNNCVKELLPITFKKLTSDFMPVDTSDDHLKYDF